MGRVVDCHLSRAFPLAVAADLTNKRDILGEGGRVVRYVMLDVAIMYICCVSYFSVWLPCLLALCIVTPNAGLG